MYGDTEAILEHLATVQATDEDKLSGVLNRLHSAGNAGALAVVTTIGSQARDLDALARLRSRFGMVVLVLIEQRLSRAGTVGSRRGGGTPVGGRGRTVMVHVTRDQPFARAWDEAMSARPTRLTGSRR